MSIWDENGCRMSNSTGDCMECSGTGEIDSGRTIHCTMTCPECNGTGWLPNEDDLRADAAGDALREEIYTERAS